jgi:type II secretory pathway pseudopilin PulG
MRVSAVSERGFTYIGLLVAVVILGLLLTIVGRMWTTTVQREREAQLLWVGDAYRAAIGSYYRHGGRYPETLQQLLQDDRSPVPVRHLRQLYPDPMTGTADWTLIPAPDGHISGVASRSLSVPIKRKGFDLVDAIFADTDCYCDWQFIFIPRRNGRQAAPNGTTPVNPAPGPFGPGLSPGRISGPGGGPSQPGGGAPMPPPGVTLPQWQTQSH